MTNILDALLIVREIYVGIPKRYEEVQRLIKTCELEIDDLQHVMEFASLSASQGFEIYRQMKDVRQRRRHLKNELEILEVIKRLQTVGKPSEKILNQTMGDVRRILNNQENRCYSMRIRKDLQELVK